MKCHLNTTQKWQTNEGDRGKMGTWRGDSTLEPAWENSHWEECDLQEKRSRKWVPTTVAGLSEARGCRKQRGSFSVSVHARLTLWDYAQPRTAARAAVSPAWPTAQLSILVTALWPGCYVFGRDVLDLRSLSMRPKPHILKIGLLLRFYSIS